MKHLAVLLVLALGGYFAWYYLNNRERVWAISMLKRHLLAVLFLVGVALFFLMVQTTFHSTKLL
jgi:hypothetical protein